MARNEAEFRDQLGILLEKEGFGITKEFKLPEKVRVDLLAIKNDLNYGIEVKINQRGISDDIVKCWQLLKMPEFDLVYVAAPDALLSQENVLHASGLGVGIIAVVGSTLEWRQDSIQLAPAQLGRGGASYDHTAIHPGKIFEIYYHATNTGRKIVRNLEMHFTPGGPFVKAPKEKTKFTKTKLEPEEDWKVTFKAKVRQNTKLGKYPFYICCTAEGVPPSSMSIEMPVSG